MNLTLAHRPGEPDEGTFREDEGDYEREYHVTWRIDLSATDPIAAAQQALDYITRWGSTAHVFDVTDADTGTTTEVDLDELGLVPGTDPAAVR